MGSLTLRLYLILGLLFGLIYMVIVLVGQSMGMGGFTGYLVFAGIMVLVQYLISPKIVEWTMGVRYVSEKDAPDLHAVVAEQATLAGIPKPKVAISEMPVPNAFAFGRGQKDGRVCVTRGILNLLDTGELKAVIGHEVAHIKNRDMMVMTMLSVVPMVMFMLARMFMFSGMFSRRRDNQGGLLAGLFFLVVYFLSNLLVLAISRIREYKADEGSVQNGNPPEKLASALYKLVYGSARLQPETIAAMSGTKAFFLNDPSQARREIRELSNLDLDRSGSIDRKELETLRTKEVKIGFGEKLMELLMTHPNMLKRVKMLSEYRA